MTTLRAITRLTLSLAIVSSSAATPAEAEKSDLALVDTPTVFEAVGDLDLSVPESPAFTALGLNPNDVARPGSPREFATSLLSAVDRDGNFQAGLALDVAPYLLFRGAEFGLDDYRANSFDRFLARTQLSIATTKGTDAEDESVRVAVGLRFTPWTKGDPRMDDTLLACLRKQNLPREEDFATLDEFQAALAASEDELAASTDGCLDESAQRLEGASGWELGLSPTWIQEGGSESEVRWGGGTFWTSLALRRSDFATGSTGTSGVQFVLHARYRLDESVADATASDGFRDQDSAYVGGRFRLTRSGLGLSLEGGYANENPDGRSADSSYRAALSGDVRLHDQLWVQVALGVTGGARNDRIFLGANLKWGGKKIEASSIVSALSK